ncbi:Hypothetical protein ETEE_2083 [Edwardsiella anguillarum ET080813]|uniref:Uncharacterized protein n=1 Tax=Edwardsiella anguillarum ET080813 TaxID=667120 RepID=A0A076LPA8_9GAMM|nr:Hypothetical protein ETEE_2083 [Edwardsiella anguillarum ET080813]
MYLKPAMPQCYDKISRGIMNVKPISIDLTKDVLQILWG